MLLLWPFVLALGADLMMSAWQIPRIPAVPGQAEHKPLNAGVASVLLACRALCELVMPTMLLQAEAKAAALAAAKAAFQKQERENAQIAEKARKQRQGRAAPAQPAVAAVKPGAGSEVRHCGHHWSCSSQLPS